MRNIIVILLLSVSTELMEYQRFTSCCSCKEETQSKGDWQSAKFRGLTMGRSTRADLLRVLGKPDSTDTPADQARDDPNPEIWYMYKKGWDFPSTVVAVLDARTNVIQAIYLHPLNLTKNMALKYYGNDYQITRYDFDVCLGTEESAPLYESPNGAVNLIEYRKLGIALAVGPKDRIDTIYYVHKPLGAASSKCKSIFLITTSIL